MSWEFFEAVLNLQYGHGYIFVLVSIIGPTQFQKSIFYTVQKFSLYIPDSDLFVFFSDFQDGHKKWFILLITYISLQG